MGHQGRGQLRHAAAQAILRGRLQPGARRVLAQLPVRRGHGLPGHVQRRSAGAVQQRRHIVRPPGCGQHRPAAAGRGHLADLPMEVAPGDQRPDGLVGQAD